jgi:hypothetical protein
MSAQSMFVRTHLVNSATEFSLRHASAHAVHVCAHAINASIAAASFRRSRLISAG